MEKDNKRTESQPNTLNDWFNDHVEVITLGGDNEDEMKEVIKCKLINQIEEGE